LRKEGMWSEGRRTRAHRHIYRSTAQEWVVAPKASLHCGRVRAHPNARERAEEGAHRCEQGGGWGGEEHGARHASPRTEVVGEEHLRIKRERCIANQKKWLAFEERVEGRGGGAWRDSEGRRLFVVTIERD
jgi:hypothetical protein